MSDRLSRVVADRLAELPPGPELASVLASVELSGLSSSELALLATAQARQVNHEQARLLAVGLELALTPFVSPDE